ncbi:hypothetical protein HDU86_008029 [Geranomyces michiganensis]|nr:hypothetical protein HDU86_008029 [Geranomyces michiganensis]
MSNPSASSNDAPKLAAASTSGAGENEDGMHVPVPPAKRRRTTAYRPLLEKPASHPLPITTFNWTYDTSLALDTNYADLALLAARCSPSQKGGMGAVLISPPAISKNPHGTILARATNAPVFPAAEGKSLKSCVEIHAEVAAVTSCARRGLSTDGAWLYVTFPPCKECVMVCLHAGIKRMVFWRKVVGAGVREACEAWGVEIVEGGVGAEADEREAKSRERCAALVKAWEDAGGDASAAKPE